MRWGYPLSTYAKFSEKLTLLTPWCAHVHVRIRGLEILVFRKILRMYFMDSPFANSNLCFLGFLLSLTITPLTFTTEIIHMICSVWLMSDKFSLIIWNANFFISNTFVSNTRLKLAKNQAKAKSHPETELLQFENYSLSSIMLSYKNNRR